MRRTFAFRLTSLRIGLAILAVHAMLGMGFVDGVMRAAMASSLPAGIGVLCLSDWSGTPADGPGQMPLRSGHDGSALCQLSGFHGAAPDTALPAFDTPTRFALVDGPVVRNAHSIPARRDGREGAPVRGPPAI